MSPRTVTVTGAFSYSGAYIAEAFLAAGWMVRTLTRNPARAHRLQGQLEAHELDFEDEEGLLAALEGAEVLVNTYWVRFDHGASSFRQAIDNNARLFRAAKAAGVKRIVHLSVSNPDANSRLPYYAGKAQVEKLLEKSGVPHSILRPTLIFGEEELLVNNIAWLLRKLPIFAVPGDGNYRLQPIYVRDLAQMALEESAQTGNRVRNGAADEVLSYSELIDLLKQVTGSRALLVKLPPWMAIVGAMKLGFLLGDVLLTRDELDGLMQERLYVGEDCTTGTHFSAWARENAAQLGQRYTNEIKRHHQSKSIR